MAYQQLLRRVAMMTWAYDREYYELVAISARVIAELYTRSYVDDDDRWSLYEDMWLCPEPAWPLLEICRRLGNTYAHPHEHSMSASDGYRAYKAATKLAERYVARAQAVRSRL